MAKFHFSPRPNLAHEIAWREWGSPAFQNAQAEDKPVLLSISAVWCHWCHVMDETGYSDPEIINFINENFIPIRVDTDQRPDVNERYNMGGWPTTAVLGPSGQLLSGGTYIPPRQLLPFLKKLLRLYRENRQELEAAAAPENRPEKISPAEEITWEPYEWLVESARRAYDGKYGGFGREPKFPMPDAIELALYTYATQGDAEQGRIATHTLAAMAGGGMYDRVEGGFFRYSTTRDWSVPHFEKMLEDNAQLLRCLLLACQATGERKWADMARDVLRFLENNLYQPETGGWSGTQDADEEYYKLDGEARRQRRAPFIDLHIYSDWNGSLARSLCLADWTLGEPRWSSLAMRTLDLLWEKAFQPVKGMAHFLGEEGPGRYGLLRDQVAVGEACLAVYQGSGEVRWLERSRRLYEFCLSNLAAPGGGYYDIVPDPQEPGALSAPRRDVRENAHAARWLLQMAALTGDDNCREQARATLQSLGDAYREYGLTAAGFAMATAEAMTSWKVVRVVGASSRKDTSELLHAALSTYRPPAVAILLDPESDREQVTAAGFSPADQPQAYLCRGTRCFPPVMEPEELRGLLNQDDLPAGPGPRPLLEQDGKAWQNPLV